MKKIMYKYWAERLAHFKAVGNTSEATIAEGALKQFGG